MNEPNKPFNPLKILWNVISTVSGAIGLISIAEDWHDWQEHIIMVLEQYRSIVYWPFDFLNFKLPNWTKDYIFIGSLFAGSLAKAGGKKFWNGDEDLSSLHVAGRFFVGLFICAFCIVIWPLGLITLIQSYITPNLVEGKVFSLKDLRSALHWLLASILLFVLVLICSVVF